MSIPPPKRSPARSTARSMSSRRVTSAVRASTGVPVDFSIVRAVRSTSADVRAQIATRTPSCESDAGVQTSVDTE